MAIFVPAKMFVLAKSPNIWWPILGPAQVSKKLIWYAHQLFVYAYQIMAWLKSIA